MHDEITEALRDAMTTNSGEPAPTFQAAVLEQLTRIGDALTILAAAVTMEEPEQATEGCQHPVDLRVDLGDGDWDCGVRECRYQHRETSAVPV